MRRGKEPAAVYFAGRIKKLFPQLTAVAASDEAAGDTAFHKGSQGKADPRAPELRDHPREDSEFLELFRHFMMNEEQRENVEKTGGCGILCL